MKRTNLYLLLPVVMLVWGQVARAEDPAHLQFQLDSGLTINGTAGSVYAIQYRTNFGPEENWSFLSFFKLPGTSAAVPGTLPAGSGSRFYRVATLNQTNLIYTNLIYIPQGTFMLGSPTNEQDRSSDEGPQTTVTLTKGFWMGKYLVSQLEYVTLMTNNPSSFQGDPNLPVEQVLWSDATNYCFRLTQRELAAGRIPAGSVYRLPTESEWEYACRAGTTTRFSFGDDTNYTALTNYAWYADNSASPTNPFGQTYPVGLLQPNPWGLYDIYGNVWEWCLDWYAPYPGGSVTDPQGPATGDLRVSRGGSWRASNSLCRTASRDNLDPAFNYDDCGFRVVLAPD